MVARTRSARLFSDGVVYAMASAARRHSLLPDGRDLLDDWITYNDGLTNCIGRADALTPG